MDKKSQDAIGKCFKILVYRKFLKNHMIPLHTPNEYLEEIFQQNLLLLQNGSSLDVKLQDAASKTYEKIMLYIANSLGCVIADIRFRQITIDPQAHEQENSIDSTLLKISVNSESNLKEFAFSLKVSKNRRKLLIRNPGLNAVLDEKYFDIAQLADDIQKLHRQFNNRELDDKPDFRPNKKTDNRHANALIKAKETLYFELSQAKPMRLVKGIRALLGNAPWVIATYGNLQKITIVDIPEKISNVQVADIEKTLSISLQWGEYTIFLRVKFTSGTSERYKWSSLKLAVTLEYS